MTPTDSPSRAMAAKALTLPTKATGARTYIVGSGSEPGVVYTVEAEDVPGGWRWTCSCVAPGPCSHRYAVLAARDPAVRRLLRRIASGKSLAAERTEVEAAPVAVGGEA